MRKNRSFLSMDNLDIEEEEDEDYGSEDSAKSSMSLSMSQSASRRKLRGYASGDSGKKQGNKPLLTDRTVDHKKEN